MSAAVAGCRLDVDVMAVDRLAAGRWQPKRHGEPRLDDVLGALQLMVSRKLPVGEIAERLHVSDRQVQRWNAALAAGQDPRVERRGTSARRAA